jgi:hypothetical protein
MAVTWPACRSARWGDIPILLVDCRKHRAVDESLLSGELGDEELADTAVLLHTGGDGSWGTRQYAENAHI